MRGWFVPVMFAVAVVIFAVLFLDDLSSALALHNPPAWRDAGLLALSGGFLGVAAERFRAPRR